jgi:ABC-type multidrug transport system fused ATPase/permease subunit
MSLASELWSILTPPQRRQVLMAQTASLCMAFSTVTGIAAIAPFFAVLGDPRLIDRNSALHWLYIECGQPGKRAFIAILGSAFIAVVVLSNLINVLGSLIMTRLATRIGNELQTALFSDYLSRPYSFHASTNSATLVKNTVYESIRVTHGVLWNTLILVASLITAAAIVCASMLVNPAVTAVAIAALATGYGLLYLAVRNRVLRAGRALSRLTGEQMQTVAESFGAIKELILLQTAGFFGSRLERISKALAAAVAHNELVTQIPRPLMECVAVAGFVGVALVLAGRNDGVGPWVGQLTFLAFAAFRLLPTLQQIFALIVKIRADRPALALIAPDLRRALSVRQALTALARPPGSSSQASPAGEIRVENAFFRYAVQQPWALRGVSLRIPARWSVGIVGANGSGKTTLVDLIAGLLVPCAGRVLVDGLMLDEGNRTAWHAQVAYVPQNTFLRDASIAENIALGVEPRDVDSRRMLEAARLAQLNQLIEALPRGLEHRVGERGIQLSGGQRQRIGIARALYREASVLLLDEATNALDGLTERELMATLEGLKGRYTSVLVAHRMSTVRACDLIFQLENGQIIASGTYDELVRDSEAFRRMAGLR